MSNFTCEYCGTDCIDSEKGYVTGCDTYPPNVGNNKQERCPPNMQNLKTEILKNIGCGPVTIEQLTRWSKITSHEHRVGLCVRELQDEGKVVEHESLIGTFHTIPQYKLAGGKK